MKFAKNIYELTDILYVPCRLFGIFPLSRKLVGGRHVYESTPINWKIILPTIAVMFSMTTGAIYICYIMVYKQSNHLFESLTNLYILLIDPYISGTLTAATMLIRRKKLLILLNHLNNIDVKLKSVGITPPYKLVTILAWSASIAIPMGLTIWATEMYAIRRDSVNHLMWRMCFTPCYIMYNYFMTLYSGMLIIIYQRFCLVNRMIKSMHASKCDVVVNLLPKTKMLHYLLCEQANELARYLDLPIFFVTVKIYITTIACVLSFYGMVPHMHSELTVWMSIYWIYFLLSVVISELINIESRKPGPLLCEITASFYIDEIGRIRNTFLLQLLEHKINFNFFGIECLSLRATINALADMLSILSFLLYLRNENE